MVRSGEAQGRRGPTIGVPIDNAWVWVVDGYGKLSPRGAVGELCIGGEGVGRGYLNREELTKEAFVADPFSAEAGARMYRSGDAVRWGNEGKLEYVGRRDGQMKVRGNRVEVGEVEVVLGEHPGVRAAAVVGREETGGGVRLVGYVSVREGEVVDGRGLREWMRRRVPEYMVPTQIVVVGELPRTANGKVDKVALAKVEPVVSGGAEEEGEQPREEVERMVAGIWAEVLGVQRVGLNDNFFDLGGHSLLIVQVHERLRRQVGEGVSIVDLFQYPTVGSLSRFLSGRHDMSRKESGDE